MQAGNGPLGQLTRSAWVVLLLCASVVNVCAVTLGVAALPQVGESTLMGRGTAENKQRARSDINSDREPVRLTGVGDLCKTLPLNITIWQW